MGAKTPVTDPRGHEGAETIQTQNGQPELEQWGLCFIQTWRSGHVEAFLCVCDITAHSLLQQHPPLCITPKSICRTAPVHPTLTTAESSSIWFLLIKNMAYSALEGETDQICRETGPAPGVHEGMSRHRVDKTKVTVSRTTPHLTFAVLLNSKQSCSSSLSFFEAITGLGTAKTRYSPRERPHQSDGENLAF